MKSYQYKTKIQRKFTKLLLRAWNNTLRRYERIWGTDDLAYVYGEQANIGILAIAAEKAGGLPFLEFSTEKGKGKGHHQGRADLQIITHSGDCWDIEAKRVQRKCDAPDLEECIKAALNDAVRDVKNISHRSDKAMGIVFVIPYGVTMSGNEWADFEMMMMDLTVLKADFSATHLCKTDIWANTPHVDCPGIGIVGRYVFK
ncbi:hypothetical protein [Dehalococcoides mccartyi]|uniref:hypothetical protein n=1 Tax=Dehalococcoides mccartyi TaxID=61435 RepID=UPI0002B76CAF|nr:hypothetical protein [Dehalococcoides mccartyi]AGG07385.1 hypothetical protein btf_276 [Dehalococcoides mccartyi BTF08]AQW61787.1 hypothetical protein B1779_00405 [Dehalococcoides mccartyi]